MTEQNIKTAHWYLVYTKPRGENIALTNLERQGYETYLPLMRQRRRRRNKLTAVIEPMFPRYLFIKLAAGIDNWAPIRSTIGVANMVRFGQLAAKVPGGLIEDLRSREDESGIQKLPDLSLKKGDKVLIAEGPLAGYEAIYHSRTSKERVTVLLEMIGNHTRASVDLKHLEISP